MQSFTVTTITTNSQNSIPSFPGLQNPCNVLKNSANLRLTTRGLGFRTPKPQRLNPSTLQPEVKAGEGAGQPGVQRRLTMGPYLQESAELASWYTP